MKRNRVTLIVGATGGIGSALARRLRRAGAPIALTARDAARLAELGAELDAPTRVLDTDDWTAVDEAHAWASQLGEGLAGVANLVGSLLLKPAHTTSEDEFRRILSTNLGSAFACVRAAAKLPRAVAPGSIVLVSSAAAALGLANHEAIAAAKAGVEGLVRASAATYASRGLRVNGVAPGLTRTPLTRRLWASERAAAASEALHPLGMLGEPEHVASAIAWLLDPTQAWVTGQILSVDGGLANVRPPIAAAPSSSTARTSS